MFAHCEWDIRTRAKGKDNLVHVVIAIHNRISTWDTF